MAEKVADIDVGLFVYNAAIAPAGRFLDVPLGPQLASVAADCAMSLALCHLLARPMVERGRGGICLIGSNAANAGAVKFAAYHAGKAFQWIFAESLWAELGDHGHPDGHPQQRRRGSQLPRYEGGRGQQIGSQGEGALDSQQESDAGCWSRPQDRCREPV